MGCCCVTILFNHNKKLFKLSSQQKLFELSSQLKTNLSANEILSNETKLIFSVKNISHNFFSIVKHLFHVATIHNNVNCIKANY